MDVSRVKEVDGKEGWDEIPLINKRDWGDAAVADRCVGVVGELNGAKWGEIKEIS